MIPVPLLVLQSSPSTHTNVTLSDSASVPNVKSYLWLSCIIKLTHYFSAWIGSSSFALAFVVGPLTGVACRRFGCSTISILGALLFGLGLFLSAYVDSIYKLYITYSLLIAVGSSCIYYSSILVLRDYFSRNFALVNGIALSGVGIGTIALAPVLDFLLVHFKWRVTLKIMSGMSLVFVFSGLIYYLVPKPDQPSTLDEKTGNKQLLDFSVFQNKAYLVWTVVVVLVMFGFYVPYVHLVSYWKTNT